MEKKKHMSLAMQIFVATLLAIFAGVDRIFDMGRTTVNITGDAACAIVVSNMEAKREAKEAGKQ